MTALLSMAAFALASSISPGPVNVVALSAGAQHGLAASLRHVTGATVGFTLLLLLIGLGLHELLARFPNLIEIVKWAGVGFLLYMAYKLTLDNGQLGAGKPARRPSFAHGAAMQWLKSEGVARIAGRHGRICGRRRRRTRLAIRGAVLRALLSVDRELGLCRHVFAQAFA
ncbi:threonine/homoserine/homoserine lactone efflux protein [Paraburkholderia youngii]